MTTGTITKVAGPLVIAEGMRDANMFDVVRVSSQRLIGEIIEMHGDKASIQVYEETSGLGPGETVESTGAPLSVELGPGLIGSIFDGIQRPLAEIMKVSGTNLQRGIEVPSLNREARWHFVPSVKPGDEVRGGDTLGIVQETPVVRHHILVPPGLMGTVESIAEITPEMLYDCCKAFYAPGNMVLAAAGNTSMEQILAACARHGLMDERPAEKVERLLRPEPMTLAAAEKTIAMPIAKSCFGLGFKEEPLPFGDLRSEMLYELILCCICGGMSPLYRRLYDEGLTNPGFGGEVLRVDGCCCILFTGESDRPDTVRQLLLDEIERVRKEGVDREIFTLCKNEKYGQLIENLENVEDSASQMADFALAGQTVAQQITMLAGLTAEDADAALQHILRPERMAVMYIEPDGTAVEDEEEEETEE